MPRSAPRFARCSTRLDSPPLVVKPGLDRAHVVAGAGFAQPATPAALAVQRPCRRWVRQGSSTAVANRLIVVHDSDRRRRSLRQPVWLPERSCMSALTRVRHLRREPVGPRHQPDAASVWLTRHGQPGPRHEPRHGGRAFAPVRVLHESATCPYSCSIRARTLIGDRQCHAATSVLRGRPRGRLRAITAPRSNSSPPHTPQGSRRSRAPARQTARRGQSRQ